MSRSADVRTLNCPILPRERLVCDSMKAKTGVHSYGDLVRVALYQLARQLDEPIDPVMFHVRGGLRRGSIRWKQQQARPQTEVYVAKVKRERAQA